MVDLALIAEETVKMFYTTDSIFGSSELTSFPLSINSVLELTDIELPEDKMINVYRGHFNPKERTNPKEQFMVMVVADLEKENVILACTIYKTDCCSRKMTIKINN